MPAVSGLLKGTAEEDDGKSPLGGNESLRKMRKKKKDKKSALSDSNTFGPGLLQTVLGVTLASNGGDT